MKLISYSFLVIFLVFFTGCATKIELAEYKDVSSISTLDINDVSKVYKTPIVNIDDIKVTSEEYSKFLHSDLLSQINDTKIIKIKNNGFSDYKIEITLDSLSAKSSFTKRRWIKTGKDKKGRPTGYYSDPYWTYYTYATVSAKVINTKTKDVYAYKKDGYYSFSVNGYYERALKSSAYTAAISDANESIINSIANDIIPRAKIISSKVNIDDDDDYIFLINMGFNQGIKSQQRAYVYKTLIEKDQIKGHTLKNSIYIGKATISNQVSSNNAWIVLDDEDNNKIVKIGDEVKITFNNNFY